MHIIQHIPIRHDLRIVGSLRFQDGRKTREEVQAQFYEARSMVLFSDSMVEKPIRNGFQDGDFTLRIHEKVDSYGGFHQWGTPK